jgi:hypothetical protein
MSNALIQRLQSCPQYLSVALHDFNKSLTVTDRSILTIFVTDRLQYPEFILKTLPNAFLLCFIDRTMLRQLSLSIVIGFLLPGSSVTVNFFTPQSMLGSNPFLLHPQPGFMLLNQLLTRLMAAAGLLLQVRYGSQQPGAMLQTRRTQLFQR